MPLLVLSPTTSCIGASLVLWDCEQRLISDFKDEEAQDLR
jgi:hypothetical protein